MNRESSKRILNTNNIKRTNSVGMSLSKINQNDDWVSLTGPFPRKKKFIQTNQKDLVFSTEPCQIKNLRRSVDYNQLRSSSKEQYAGKLSYNINSNENKK